MLNPLKSYLDARQVRLETRLDSEAESLRETVGDLERQVQYLREELEIRGRQMKLLATANAENQAYLEKQLAIHSRAEAETRGYQNLIQGQ